MNKRIHVPNHFDTEDGSTMSFTELHRKFAQTHHGEHLNEQIRFGRYKPESVTNAEWRKALGRDVNNLEHMALTRDLTRAYLRAQLPEQALNLSDSQTLQLAATTHDWAEAITDDKMFDQKTANEDADEATIMMFLLKRALGKKLGPENLKKVYETVKNRQSRLGNIFYAIEGVGYLRTALNAWRLSKGLRVYGNCGDPELREGYEWLASNVVGNQIVVLLKHAEKYHPVAVYLGHMRTEISSIFAEIPIHIFENYPTEGESGDEQTKQFQKFMAANKAWQNSKFAVVPQETAVKKIVNGGVQPEPADQH